MSDDLVGRLQSALYARAHDHDYDDSNDVDLCLLAEEAMRRIEALQRLCGRAAKMIDDDRGVSTGPFPEHKGDHPAYDLWAELREAAKSAGDG